jgi:hypothetical protein
MQSSKVMGGFGSRFAAALKRKKRMDALRTTFLGRLMAMTPTSCSFLDKDLQHVTP